MNAIEERFWSKVDKNGPVPEDRPDLGPCWIWTAGGGSQGYGQFCVNYKDHYAHRWICEQVNGPIPLGLVVDHLCNVRRCVNPGHLMVTTNKANVLRGNSITAAEARQTHCHKGHPFDLFNTHWRKGREWMQRRCRKCDQERELQRKARRRQALRQGGGS